MCALDDMCADAGVEVLCDGVEVKSCWGSNEDLLRAQIEDTVGGGGHGGAVERREQKRCDRGIVRACSGAYRCAWLDVKWET